MTKVDENIQTAQNMLSWIVERCHELEEENKKLKEHKENLIRADKKKSEHIEELEEENKKLKEELRMLKEWATLYREDNKKLKETIKDHQLYEEKLEHRIIEFEELLHWE